MYQLYNGRIGTIWLAHRVIIHESPRKFPEMSGGGKYDRCVDQSQLTKPLVALGPRPLYQPR